MSSPLQLSDGELAEFIAQLRGRLTIGAQQYGGTSFQRPLIEVIGEVQAELLDTAGWGVLAWARLERLRSRVAQLGDGGAS